MRLFELCGGRHFPVRQLTQPINDMVFLASLCVNATLQYHCPMCFYLEYLELHHPAGCRHDAGQLEIPNRMKPRETLNLL